ncbi:tyrosine-protein phosphatase CDC14 [Hypoxylon argillaceum]|nr:tyrosine-protein phosphatase CDC14 [Hypoxylon argillaceum]KAI1148873.1 tyrosine-protein phosphatase CDC14 [Nemania diffusa]
MPSSKASGLVVEYLPNRLYLASYAHAPTSETPFPYPESNSRGSPTKRSQRAVDGPLASSSKAGRQAPYYFSIDDILLYNAFHHDFGPLHIGHLYRFALQFHDVLGAKSNETRPIVFWSYSDPKSRANAACMLACYMVLIQSWPPHLALAPIAQVEPPLMPFRDAGYSQADYGLTVQDVVYGVWKAKEEGCCALDNFDLDEYERFERVEHGDFNWVTPHFLAFASPQYAPVDRIPESSEEYATLPKNLEELKLHPGLPQPFKNVLHHFSERNIGLVVRLNSPLYSPSFFEALGIRHLDMIFEDGTCPPLSTVRKFIRLAHETITIKKKSIAVHCKAGLGRTGCLIGAYLIYRHGFTADEIISFMRFMRPGMVVGPQQHWLHINQGVFREWWIEERIERKLRKEMAANIQPSTPIRAMQRTSLGRNPHASTPPSRTPSSRTPLGEVDQERRNAGIQEDYLPAPTPGQPRKTGRADRHHPYQRSQIHQTTLEEEEAASEETDANALQRKSNDAESEEEWMLRMRTRRKVSHSPERSEKSRSYSQTTTTTIYQVIDNDASNDAENIGSGRPKAIGDHVTGSPTRSASASGVLTKVRSSKRTTDSTRVKESSGVRKTSGRVGSVNATGAHSAVRKVSAM